MSTTIPSEGIRNKLRDRREALGLSRQRLADIMGVSLGTVQKWEDGRINLSSMKLENYMSLCEALQCDLSYLVTDQNLPTKEATDIQLQTKLSAAASQKLVKMGNQWYALRGLDALLRYEGAWLLEQIGFYLVSKNTESVEAPNGNRVPIHLLYANAFNADMAILRSLVQKGELIWPEYTEPDTEDRYIML